MRPTTYAMATGRISALFAFVYSGTTPLGSIAAGCISSGRVPRAALLVGA